MASFGSRRGFADRLSLPLMVVAFLAVGGFLYWLNMTAEPTEVAVAEESEETSSDFLQGPEQWLGQVVEVTDARANSTLGSQAFGIGPDNAPFLVKMAPALVSDSTTVPTGQPLTLVGTVHTLTDSVLTAWDAQGAFAREGDRALAEYFNGSPFLEATSVIISAPGGGPGGAASGGGTSGGGR
jgi:hypothetical protein